MKKLFVLLAVLGLGISMIGCGEPAAPPANTTPPVSAPPAGETPAPPAGETPAPPAGETPPATPPGAEGGAATPEKPAAP